MLDYDPIKTTGHIAMTGLPAPALPNPSQRIVYRFLIIAAVFLASTAISGGLAWATGAYNASKDDTAASVIALVSIISGSISLAMLLCALLSIPALRATGRILAEFSRGEALADWTYSPAEWDAYVAHESRRLALSPGLVLTLFSVIAVVVGIVCCSAAASWRGALIACAAALAIIAILGVAIAAGIKLMRRRRMEALRRHPRVLIGRNGLYCGNVFRLWGSNMIALQSLRRIGDPPMLQFVTGSGSGVRAANAAVGAAAVLAGGNAAAVSSMQWVTHVPVPAGKTAEADDLVRTLLGV